MRFPHFFIDRPIFAAVLSIFITIVGGIVPTAPGMAPQPDVAYSAPPSAAASAAGAGR